MKTSIVIILTLILYSCHKPIDNYESNILSDTIIKKERIIRYKILPNKSNLHSPFCESKNDNDIHYTFYLLNSFDRDTTRLPTLRQFEGYEIIETNLTGDTVKTYIYDTHEKLTETKISISNDSIKFYRKIDIPSGNTYTSITLTTNNIKKDISLYESELPPTAGMCGWKPKPEWDNITYLDSNNNPIKITSYFSLEQLFKYNSKGNIVYYNFNNQLIEERHVNNFSMINKTIHEYKNDTLTQLLHYDIDNNLIFSQSTSYVYDKYGNWIKKNESINSIPRFVTEREITY